METLKTNDPREYFVDLQRRLPAVQGPLAALRSSGIERFGAVGFPTTRDEEWRFTNVAPALRKSWNVGTADAGVADVDRFRIPSLDTFLAVFVNGVFSPRLSELKGLPKGVWVGSLREAGAEYGPLIEQHLGRHATVGANPFTALNAAFAYDGAFIYVSRGVVVEKTIELLFVSAGTDNAAFPRNLIIGDVNSQFSVVESYVSDTASEHLNLSVTEIVADENAFIDHYKLNRENLDAYHFGATMAHQSRDSNFSTHTLTFGGRIVRNDVSTVLDAEGCTGTLNGLYVISGEQLVDNHTTIDHAKPHCESHELYKGILDGKSRGVFNGRIIVRPDAQKTNSKQTNKNLLLSKEALLNTNPQLEIFADDVKCTHGATIGQLDAESLFYLRARGIGLEAARSILTFAFANDLLERVKLPAVRAELERNVYAIKAVGKMEHE